MPWREDLSPVRMERVSLVCPLERRREALTEVARHGTLELDLPYEPGTDAGELDRAEAAAVVRGPLAAWAGWSPAHDVPALAGALAPRGAGLVPLKKPRGTDPPTLLAGGGSKQAAPRPARLLVDTYTTVPYGGVDPALLAALAYVIMFGMMFGDAGQGLLLVAAGLVLRTGRVARLRRWRGAWLFVTGAGLAAVVFGVLYGEFFGPTGVLPVLWLDPLEEPIPLLIAAVLFGAVLLAGAYALGTVNRIREGGWGYALYARSGLAGSALFLAVGLLAWGLVAGAGPLVLAAAVLGVLALGFIFVGLFTESGGGAGGGLQASVELVDTVVQLGSNLVSFARLAAFGLTHAALMGVVWDGTTALWAPDWRAVAAVLVFLVGNAVTFALEGLVAGIQALRLEYYELFSRVFQAEGRRFRPWAPDLDGAPGPDAAGSPAGAGSPAPAAPAGTARGTAETATGHPRSSERHQP